MSSLKNVSAPKTTGRKRKAANDGSDDNDDNDGDDEKVQDAPPVIAAAKVAAADPSVDAMVAELDCLLKEKQNMEERWVTVVMFSQQELDSEDPDMEIWDPSLLIKGDQHGMTRYGTGFAGPGAHFGDIEDFTEAAKFLFDAEGSCSWPNDTMDLLCLSPWNFHGHDPAMNDTEDGYKEMIETTKFISAVPGPWTVERLSEALRKVYEVIHMEASDDESDA